MDEDDNDGGKQSEADGFLHRGEMLGDLPPLSPPKAATSQNCEQDNNEAKKERRRL